MKIRIGFVSNSSTTSFCIYGACLEGETELKKLYGKLKGISEEKVEEMDSYEITEEITKSSNLECNWGCDMENLYIGRNWSSVKDSETGKQFKDNIKAELKKIFKEDLKCDTHEEAYRDG